MYKPISSKSRDLNIMALASYTHMAHLDREVASWESVKHLTKHLIKHLIKCPIKPLIKPLTKHQSRFIFLTSPLTRSSPIRHLIIMPLTWALK